jgi:hypothetical protein
MSGFYVRLSPTMRELVDACGPVSDGARALLLIGAAAAGLDVQQAEADAGRLLGADLDPRVLSTLKRLFFSSTDDIGDDISSDSAQDIGQAKVRPRLLGGLADHNYRARQLGAAGDLMVADWEALCARYGHRCLGCGLKRPLSPDHVIPLARGGMNTIDNIQPLCRSHSSIPRQRMVRTVEIRTTGGTNYTRRGAADHPRRARCTPLCSAGAPP